MSENSNNIEQSKYLKLITDFELGTQGILRAKHPTTGYYLRTFPNQLRIDRTKKIWDIENKLIFKISDWKNTIKSLDTNISLDKKLCYLLIYDFDTTSLNRQKYTVENLAFIFQNRQCLDN